MPLLDPIRLYPVVILKNEHEISREKINKNALSVISTLKNAGFQAYVVGGGIRDLLLRVKPKDFDVVTNAEPQQIKNIFSNCRLIGRRFRLAHLYFGREIIEVATFRANTIAKETSMGLGLIIRDNVYGKIDEDVLRRDLTINALYYDIDQEVLLDFVDGYQDIKKKKIRIIGDPETRYREDPVRMLRVLRFAAKLHFTLEKNTQKPIAKIGHTLLSISASRLYDEVVKVFYCGNGKQAFSMLCQYNLFEYLFSSLKPYIKQKKIRSFVETVLGETDLRIKQNKPVIHAFVFACLFWFPFLETKNNLRESGYSLFLAPRKAAKTVLNKACKTINMPRYVQKIILDIWMLQNRFEQNRFYSRSTFRYHPRFKAAFDFFIYRSKTEKHLKPLIKNWNTDKTTQ